MQNKTDCGWVEGSGFARTLLDTIGALVVLVDRAGRIVHFNRAAEELTGYSAEEVRGDYWYRFLIAEEAEAAKSVFTSLVVGDFPSTHENHWVTRSGELRWIAWSNTVLLDHQGEVEYVVGTGVDMTASRRAAEDREALRQSEDLFRELADNVQEVFFVRDATRKKMLYVSRAYEQIWGRPCSGLYEDPSDFINSVHPEDRERVVQAVAEQTQERFFDDSYRIIRPDGAVRWIRARTFPVRNAAGEMYRYAGIAEDFTERKQVEDALRASEERLSRSQRYANIGTWDWDIQTDHLCWSDPIPKLLGYAETSQPPAVFESFLRVVHPEDRRRVRDAIDDCIERGVPYDVEHRIVHPDGSIRWMHERGDVVRAKDGTALRMLGLVQDITGRKKAEQALRESEGKYRAIMEAASDAIFVCDLNASILDVNRKAEELLGHTRGELLNMNARQIHPDSERENLQAAFRDIQTKGSSLYEHLVLRKDGTTAAVEVAGTLVHYQGKTGALGIFRDLTERRQTELMMAKLSSAVEQTADAILITDDTGRIEYVNRGFETLTGYSRQEVIGRNPRLLNSGRQDRAFYRRLWDTISDGRVFRDVFANRRKDGSLYYEEKTINPLRAPEGHISHFISSGKDVTARLEAEQERRAAEAAQRETLVREVHHRIKNHLQGLIGLLRQSITAHPEMSVALEGIIGQIYSVATVHGLQGSAGHGEIRLCDMMEAICSSSQSLTGRCIRIDSKRESSRPWKIAADEAVSLALVLNELVVNAVKHSPAALESGVIWVSVNGDDSQVRVSINNQAQLPEEFDFDNDRGLGTGLKLMKALLPRQGARFRIENREGGVEACLVLAAPVLVG